MTDIKQILNDNKQEGASMNLQVRDAADSVACYV